MPLGERIKSTSPFLKSSQRRFFIFKETVRGAIEIWRAKREIRVGFVNPHAIFFRVGHPCAEVGSFSSATVYKSFLGRLYLCGVIFEKFVQIILGIDRLVLLTSEVAIQRQVLLTIFF